MSTLPSGTTLQEGKYTIERDLGQGGFGITYLAEQTMLGRKVAIKEFFMKEFCDRDEATSQISLGTAGSRDTVDRFREKFLKEARNIARLNHPNIVRVIDVFEENGTAYYVMEFADCGSLAGKIKKEGYLSQDKALRYILQVASALEYVHKQKMNHLDVKPANIMLNNEDQAILIDFGLSKQYDAVTGKQTSTTPVGISEGYAPMEQYKQGGVGEFSPETDVYSLGATLFKLLTGQTPASASDVNEYGVDVDALKAKGVQQYVIDTICKAMEPRKRDRMSSARAFIDALNNPGSLTSASDEDEATRIIGADSAATPASRPTVTQQQPTPSTIDNADDESDDRKGLIKKVAIGVCALLVVAGGYFLWPKGSDNQTVEQSALNEEKDSESDAPKNMQNWNVLSVSQLVDATVIKDFHPADQNIIDATGQTLIYEDHTTNHEEPDEHTVIYGSDCQYDGNNLMAESEHAVALRLDASGSSGGELFFKQKTDADLFMKSVEEQGALVYENTYYVCKNANPGFHDVSEYPMDDRLLVLLPMRFENDWYVINIGLDGF